MNRRRTWAHERYLGYGFDSDFENFTPTYSEVDSPTVEGTMLKIFLNGFMCGYPECCIIAYAKKWFKYSKTGNPIDTHSKRFGTTETGQPYAQCGAHGAGESDDQNLK